MDISKKSERLPKVPQAIRMIRVFMFAMLTYAIMFTVREPWNPYLVWASIPLLVAMLSVYLLAVYALWKIYG